MIIDNRKKQEKNCSTFFSPGASKPGSEVPLPRTIQSGEDSREGHQDFALLPHRHLDPAMQDQSQDNRVCSPTRTQSLLRAPIRQHYWIMRTNTETQLSFNPQAIQLLNKDTCERLHIPTSHTDTHTQNSLNCRKGFCTQYSFYIKWTCNSFSLVV